MSATIGRPKDEAASVADFGEPEELVVHTVYGPADCARWGIAPGDALCGFVFTLENEIGPVWLVAGDPRFVLKVCEPCVAVHAAFVRVIDHGA